ncbi:hypothetical protein JTB14_013066 [Gonioctena quinquepunctata]|nr:hypothetical protein JTB14_013066 [Gonioctena quinquepunctata]
MCRFPLFTCVVVFSVLAVQRADCVKCYSCFSTTSHDDCSIPDKSQISLLKCDMSALEQTRNSARHIDPSYDKLFEVDSIETEAGRMGLSCLKMVTKVGNKNYVLRGCQLAEQGNLDICKKVRETSNEIVKTVHCSKCSTEGCNSSSISRGNAFLAILLASACRLLHRSLY